MRSGLHAGEWRSPGWHQACFGLFATVAVAAALATAACAPVDNASSVEPAPEETHTNGNQPSELSDSWCSQEDQRVSFGLENGKTVSICESAGSSELTYSFGVLGKEPELTYRGPLLASIEGVGGSTLAELAAIVGQQDGEGSTDISPALAAAAAAPDSGGFFHVSTVYASGGEEEAYIFRRGGWEYAVHTGYSRNANPEIASELGDYSSWGLITVLSPGGEEHRIR